MLANPALEISDEDLEKMFIDTMIPLLTETPVLKVLNRLQRTLDILDIEGLSLLWKMAHKTESELGDGYTDPSLEEWSSFIDYYKSSPARSVHVVPDVADLDRYLLAYLLSATFKDCSIMIRMDLLPHQDNLAVKPSSVTVIDLDPKSMTRLRRWEKLDEEIVAAYVRVDELKRKHCVDDGAFEDDDELHLKTNGCHSV
jgi:inositol-pentakisphosphate 2-kinase